MKKITVVFSVLTVILIHLTYLTYKELTLPEISSSVLRLSLENKVESLDPSKAFSDESLFISSQVLEPLYQYHYLKRPYEIQPLVADSLPIISKDGKNITIKIRKNTFYHSHPAFKNQKRELIAEDFVTQFKRLALEKMKSPGRGLFNGLIIGFEHFSREVNNDWRKIKNHHLEGVFAKDKYTLVIRLNKNEPNIIYYLALNFVSPVPWELVRFYENALDSVLVGTGPYILNEFNPEFIDMIKNRDYREEYYPTVGDKYANIENLLLSSREKIPFIDKVRFFVVNEEKDRWDKFFKKQIDILTVPKTYIPNLYDQKGEVAEEIKKHSVTLKHFPILANRWFAFNMKDPLVGKNEKLRKAIAYSIDYQKYIHLLSQNTNLQSNSILVPGIPGYLPSKDFKFKYNPELAKKYLKESKLDLDTLPKITYSTRGNQSVNILEANFVKEQLEKIGLKVDIQVLSFSEFLQKGRAGELMFFTDNWLFDYPDAENILQLLVSTNFPGINKSAYSNPDIDKLYSILKETTNLDQRAEIIQEIETIIFNDVPWIPLMYESSFVLHYPELKNFRKSSIIRNYIKYLKIGN